MKFFINKDNLLYGIQNVQRAVSLKSPLPVLTGILFQCYDNKLKLSATDFEMSIYCTVPAVVEEPGELVLPARYITEFSRRLPDTTITFEKASHGQMATIRYGQSEFNINGYSTDDFPSLDLPGEEFSFNLSAELCKEIIKQVIFATSSDDARPVFTGVFFEIENNQLTLVATDTFRLALRRVSIDACAQELINVIIPGKTLTELLRLPGQNSAIKVIIGKSHAAFVAEDTVIIARLVSGRFPSYRQVIPSTFVTELKISLKEFLESAERASLLAGERSSLVNFAARGESVVLNVRSETGWIHEKVPAAVSGENMDITFNVRYLCDVLKSINFERLLIRLTGSLTPALITGEDKDDYMSILVPARQNKE